MLRPRCDMSLEANLGRRSIRLPGYDYTKAAAYFVTMCTFQRKCAFAEIHNGQLRLSEIGRIAQECWVGIPSHFPHARLDAYVIMPNHIHGILMIADGPRRSAVPRLRTVAPGSLGAIVRAFKAATTRRATMMHGIREPLWQRNYYEHIVRSEESLQKIREYICDNPVRWHSDPDNPANRGQFSEEIEEIVAGDSAPDNDR